ncbi:NAD(P)-dependent dehydrogenase (short-subunit alcohol dehydrogenase family) [Methylohalomonas lacus]|uniref:NAD(P)-dependent dehydrogenase (Short-subunit alcohol dehydrogenase family) n=1 Tax=Methylohalomonas lacus TaxID=398773 RepID=A0AAE3HL05_9GAMM|nr:SDR family NAD(P)-dependent oxidoreductase [Methylohalomonas lacus]MCS3904290.1 NAD(P)-dependent dehydrogenase (short-subunit alcohol dehydrogenase family) [Methylohalomonas lacus]
MEQRSVLVSGCSSGIGYATALGLKARGYRVFAAARSAAARDELWQKGLETVALDIANGESIRAAVTEVLDACDGRLYGLFNNAGFGQPGAVEDLSRQALREQFETNVFGTHELTHYVLPAMRRQGLGRIIQNSSVLGFIAMPYRGAYIASKHALEGLSDTLRLELAGSGIHVSLIEPGPIVSAFRANALQAFRRHVDPTLSVHRATYEAVLARLENQTDEVPFTLPPEAVLKKVVQALESRRPRARYAVTAPTHAFALLNRLLPTSWMDALLKRAAGAENRR